MFDRRTMLGGLHRLPPDMTVRGWINFSGNTPTIADSHNVSSVTKNATGRYTVTWQPGRVASDYAQVVGLCCRDTGTTITLTTYDSTTDTEPLRTDSTALHTRVSNAGTLVDSNIITAVIMGPQ